VISCKILQKFVNNEISTEEAEKMLKTSYIEELEDFAKLDTSRHLRTGIPEVTYAENKDDKDLLKELLKYGRLIMDVFEAINKRRSIRKYNMPVQDEKIEIILEACRIAPSAAKAGMEIYSS